MPVLQIVADGPRAGKTLLASALLRRLAATGQRLAYFKPFSEAGAGDADLTFVTQRLLPGIVSAPPLGAPAAALDAATGQRFQATLRELSQQADWTLVDGPDLPLAAALPPIPSARVVLLRRYEQNLTADAVAAEAATLRPQLAGVMVNGVTRYRLGETRERLLPELAARNIPALGAIPEDRQLLEVTVRQIAEQLGGAWLEAPVNPDLGVGRFLIGANIMDSGPVYLDRYDDQAVIVRAGRPDIQLAALRTPTRCLVLTGGQEPTEYIQVEARKNDVPVLLVKASAQQVAEALGPLLERSNPHTPAKVARFAQLLGEHLDVARFQALLA